MSYVNIALCYILAPLTIREVTSSIPKIIFVHISRIKIHPSGAI